MASNAIGIPCEAGVMNEQWKGALLRQITIQLEEREYAPRLQFQQSYPE